MLHVCEKRGRKRVRVAKEESENNKKGKVESNVRIKQLASIKKVILFEFGFVIEFISDVFEQNEQRFPRAGGDILRPKNKYNSCEIRTDNKNERTNK
jgi:hypothetical protein